jgi:hypothetical protein
MFDKIKDHPILVLLSMLVGAFLAGISALIFIQQQVDAGVQQQLRLQKPAFIKEISGALANVIPKPSPPIIEKSPEFFGDTENVCVRWPQIQLLQLCWGRTIESPTLNTNTNTTILHHEFSFLKPFAGQPVITTGLNVSNSGAGNAWVVYNSTTTEKTFELFATDILKGQSTVSVSINYFATGRWARD